MRPTPPPCDTVVHVPVAKVSATTGAQLEGTACIRHPTSIKYSQITMPANTRGNQEAQTSHQVSPQPAPLTEMEEIRQTIRCMSETLRLTTEMLRSTPEMNVRQAPSLVMCPARFSGEVGEDVDVFISEVTNYVRATRMTEDMARDGLGVLLRGRASSWWTTAQDTVPTWSEAITKLQEVFGARQPDFQIIWEIFGQRQGQEETKFFAQRATKLFGRLNFATCERLHVATIYGLLEKKIRTRIPFKAATTVEALVGLATEVEAELTQERIDKPQEPKTPSHAVPVAKTRPFCTACRRNGHMAAECRTTRREPAMRRPRGTPTAPTKAAADEARRAPFACYGCGQEGVIRSNCRTCSRERLEVYAVTEVLRSPPRRPKQRPFCLQCRRHGHLTEICQTNRHLAAEHRTLSKPATRPSHAAKSLALCFRCRKPGHLVAECRRRQRSKELGGGPEPPSARKPIIGEESRESDQSEARTDSPDSAASPRSRRQRPRL